MEIIKHINSYSFSNTYILSVQSSEWVWIIDPGDSCFMLDWLSKERKKIRGLLVTHSHVDHIYGINELRKQLGTIPVYVSEAGSKGIVSAKLNLSEYHEAPYVVENKDLRIVYSGSRIELWDGVILIIHDTPGHNEESLSFQVEKHLFTGDALIPGVKVFTKFHGGDKRKARETIDWVYDSFPSEQMIWPGHGEACELQNIIKAKLI